MCGPPVRGTRQRKRRDAFVLPAELPDRAHERVPVHARHRNVAHQHVGRLVLECLERVGSAADRDHLRAAVREHRSNVAGVGVVIDEPDAKEIGRAHV